MRVVVIAAHGGPDRLRLAERPDPAPAAGEVVVRVRACGLNHLDLFVLRGMPGVPIDLPRIPGADIAGTVEAVGPDVSADWLGRRVLVDPMIPGPSRFKVLGEHADGGPCERLAVGEGHLLTLPETVSFAQAAALPIAYGTARKMLARGQLRAGETVLILGASGGVGTACIQLAKAAGAVVIAATGSAAKLERLRALGADHVIDTGREDFSARAWAITGKQGVDVIVNPTGGDTWVPSLRALKLYGRLLTCGATAGYDPRTDIRYIWRRQATILGSDGWTREDVAALVEDVAAGRIAPVIDRVLPLAGAAEGFRALRDREVFGKAVITP